MRKPFGIGDEIENKFFGEICADISASAHNPADRFDQLRPWTGFSDVTGSARFQNTPRKLLLCVHAEDEHWKLWTNLLQRLYDLNLARFSQVRIEDCHIPILIAHEFEGIAHIACFTEFGGACLLGEGGLHTIPKNFMSIDNQDFCNLIKYQPIQSQLLGCLQECLWIYWLYRLAKIRRRAGF